MCLAKVGKIVKTQGKEALVKFKNRTEKIDISLIKGLKVNDKIICSGKVAIEKLED